MEYTSDTMIFDLYDFETWSGATYTKNTIIKANKVEEFNDFIEEVFYDRVPTETTINDFLWFDDEYIYESLDINEYLVNFTLEDFPAKGEAIEVKKLLLKDINEFGYNETEEEFVKLLKDELDPSNDEEVNDYINGDPLYILECFNIENPFFEVFDLEEYEPYSDLAGQTLYIIFMNDKANEFIELIQNNLDLTLDYLENLSSINEFLEYEDEFIFTELKIEL